MIRKNGEIPPFRDAACEHEWRLQEDAMRRERLHLNARDDDSRSQRYRLLVRALEAPPAAILPADFAQQMSTLAAAQTPDRTASMRLERVLMSALTSAFLLAAVAVTLIYAATWRPLFEAALPAPAAAQWLWALIGCVGVSWLLGAWPPLARLANRAGGESR